MSMWIRTLLVVLGSLVALESFVILWEMERADRWQAKYAQLWEDARECALGKVQP